MPVSSPSDTVATAGLLLSHLTVGLSVAFEGLKMTLKGLLPPFSTEIASSLREIPLMREL